MLLDFGTEGHHFERRVLPGRKVDRPLTDSTSDVSLSLKFVGQERMSSY